MSALIHLAIRRPIGTIMLYLGLLVVALVSFRRLAVDLFPDIDFPAISIVTGYAGVGPQEIETLITRPIEQVVSTIQGVESIESTCSEGVSSVRLRFDWGTDLEVAINDVRANLDRVANRLPEDADRPVVYKFDLSAMPVAMVGLSGSGDPRRLRNLAEETFAPRLEQVAGVAAVDVRGGHIREIRVELDASRLIALGVSAEQVVAALSRDNRNVSAGDMLDTGQEVLVRTLGEWSSPEDIENVLVAVRDSRPIYVRDVAHVLDTYEEISAELWIDGEPGITLTVLKESGTNTVEVVDALRAEVEWINREYDGRARLSILRDSADFIRSAVTNVESAALRGAILAIFVLLIFLRNVRATLIIATAIPTSILATFMLMYFARFSLNVVTLGGLALGVGMLLDNAIVVLENIQRKRDEGEQPVQAAFDGTREVASAVVASTMTTVAVFAPVVFIGGFAGIFFAQMAAVVTFALACSLLVALTLVPTLAARIPLASNRVRPTLWGRTSRSVERGFSAVERGYSRLIARALRVPLFVILCAVLLLVASLRMVPFVGFELMPETDEGRIDLDVELPIGTPVERTITVMRDMAQRVGGALRTEETVSMITIAGSRSRWRAGGGNQGVIHVNLVPVTQRERSIDDILGQIRQATMGIPGVEVRVRKSSQNFLMRLMRGSAGERLAVEIHGYDLATAGRLGEQVAETMRSVEGVTDARLDREEGLREGAVLIQTSRAADLGLTRADIAQELETYVLGQVATRLREGGSEYDVRVQLREEDRDRIEQLDQLPLLTPSGAAVPLSSVAEIDRREGPMSISRLDQERIHYVLGGIAERDLGSVVADLQQSLVNIDVPEGFTLTVAGEQAEQEKTFGGLLVGVLLAIFLVYLVMSVLYESLRHPLVIMASVPFAIIGVVAILAATHTTFNINSFMGLFMLVGIVVNNAIVLVDYINLMRRERGLPLYQAVVESGRRRLRPILMTTLTTALALVPLAAAMGEGSEIQAPLARVVVGGLTSASLVTLIIIPCFYFLMSGGRGRRISITGNPSNPSK